MGGPMSRMVAFAAGLVVLAGPARAQSQAELLFQAEAQTLTGTCSGQPVRLEGNHNAVTLTGACGSLLLKGVSNTVRLGVVPGGSIHVEGSGNRVTYAVTGAPPDVTMLGPDNETTSGPAVIPPSAPPPALPKPVPQAVSVNPPPSVAAPPPKPATSMPAPATGPLLLQGDDQQHLGDCAGRDVTVTGDRSAYVLRGGCKSLTLRGNLLAVQAELASGARIAVTGRGSIVSWAVKGRAKPPSSLVRGEGSRTQRAETIGGDTIR